MVIWSEFYMEQYRDDGHREHAPHFTCILQNTTNQFTLDKWNKLRAVYKNKKFVGDLYNGRFTY